MTFYKQVASSSGHVRNVEVAKVYLSPAIEKQDVVAVALAKFEQDRGLDRWDQGADGYELEQGC